MNFTCLFFGIIFTASGLWLAFGNGYKHIPALKAMSDEERKKLNIRPLCRNVGEIIALSGIIFILKGVLPDFSGRWFVIAMIGWLIIAGLDLYYIAKYSASPHRRIRSERQQADRSDSL